MSPRCSAANAPSVPPDASSTLVPGNFSSNPFLNASLMTLMLLEPSTFTVVPLGSDLGSGKEGLGLLDWALVPGNLSSDRFLNASLLTLMLPEPSAFNVVPLGSDLGSGKEGLGLLDWATTGESIEGKNATSRSEE